ncbi:MAG: exosortase-associated protein EpsI, B-type [Betaproteobacteria bacterium]
MSDAILTRRAAIAAILMAAAAAGGQAMVPTKRMALLRGPFKLADIVPSTFGSWQVDTRSVGGIVNPQTEALLSKLYSQLLDRVYVDGQGHRIMLSIAYGADQADDDVQLHYPEVCYPAQGFRVRGNRVEQVAVAQGDIKVRRLETQFGDARFEPVTYWTIIGDEQSLSGWDRKLAEIRHGLRGEIVDGLLFRVSSIDRNSAQGFAAQDAFIKDIVAAMTPQARRQLAGLN